MSEPLKDIRSKVNAETWALIEAEIIREVLHGWSAQKWAVIKAAQKLVRAAGHDGE